MKRREFITLLSGAAALGPRAAKGQQRGALPVIGWLNLGSSADEAISLPAFRLGLREAGFVAGQNVTIEALWAENANDRVPAMAAEFIRRQVKIIVAAPNPSAIAPVQAATAAIPVVFLT